MPKTKDIRTSNPKKKKRGKERVKATSDLGGSLGFSYPWVPLDQWFAGHLII